MVRIHRIHRSPLFESMNLDTIWARTKRSLGRIAHDQRRFAISPRPDKPFDVGAGLALLTPKRELMCVGTNNFKQAIGPRQHKCPDHCAEMYGIATARKMKCKIIGMVIEAPPPSGRTMIGPPPRFYARSRSTHRYFKPFHSCASSNTFLVN